ncbi:transcription factor, putative [Ricinus communis]|uniref:Transcription factor, putative n=1 Tax=Ricinus communis TaxID=3988 RepID=B9T5B9_RICCO|nr:transcription factor, putative [Ricinus communis]
MSKQHSQSADMRSLKDEVSKLRLICLQMMGQQLDGLSFKDLQNLEHQLSDGILSVKDKKEQVLLEQLKKSRLQERKASQENEALRKQVEELRRSSLSKSPFLEFNPSDRKFSLSSCKDDCYPQPEQVHDDDEDPEDGVSDTLQLGLSCDVYGKRKAPKIEETCNDSGSQVASELL